MLGCDNYFLFVESFIPVYFCRGLWAESVLRNSLENFLEASVFAPDNFESVWSGILIKEGELCERLEGVAHGPWDGPTRILLREPHTGWCSKAYQGLLWSVNLIAIMEQMCLCTDMLAHHLYMYAS